MMSLARCPKRYVEYVSLSDTVVVVPLPPPRSLSDLDKRSACAAALPMLARREASYSAAASPIEALAGSLGAFPASSLDDEDEEECEYFSRKGCPSIFSMVIPVSLSYPMLRRRPVFAFQSCRSQNPAIQRAKKQSDVIILLVSVHKSERYSSLAFRGTFVVMSEIIHVSVACETIKGIEASIRRPQFPGVVSQVPFSDNVSRISTPVL